MHGYLVLILILIFAILVATFAIQNTTMVIVKFLFWKANISLVLIILISLAVGATLLFLVNLVKQWTAHKELKTLKQQNALLTKEKEELSKALGEREQGAAGEPESQARAQETRDTVPEPQAQAQESQDAGQKFPAQATESQADDSEYQTADADQAAFQTDQEQRQTEFPHDPE